MNKKDELVFYFIFRFLWLDKKDKCDERRKYTLYAADEN